MYEREKKRLIKKESIMYMAPLNYDKFFKKVFRKKKIAKAFLEDVFDIEIQEINKLSLKNRITDIASIVEFDYRCKIDDQYVIIEMQQWHKPDVAHRFYMYHAINTALQLENLPMKQILTSDENGLEIIKDIKDYRRADPVITFVWCVDENFGNKNDFLTYAMTPEDVIKFITDEIGLWDKNKIETLFAKREEILKMLNNNKKNKDLSFIPKSKLIFAFQQNIVENPIHKKYFNWFSIADKSRNKKNKKKDFIEIEKDKSFKDNFIEIKERICEKGLSVAEKKYLLTEDEAQARIQRYIDGILDSADLAGKVEDYEEQFEEFEEKFEEFEEKLDNEKRKAEEADKKAEEEKRKAEEADKKAETTLKVLSEKLNISIEEARLMINV